MLTASLIDRPSDAQIEAQHLWMLSGRLEQIRRVHIRTGTGAAELRDDLDLLAEMATCRSVAAAARRRIADIDRQWPHMAVA